jgi:hypothetical protein
VTVLCKQGAEILSSLTALNFFDYLNNRELLKKYFFIVRLVSYLVSLYVSLSLS